jgi:hypothetical protein
MNLWAHMQDLDEIVHSWESLILVSVTLNENDLMGYQLGSEE